MKLEEQVETMTGSSCCPDRENRLFLVYGRRKVVERGAHTDKCVTFIIGCRNTGSEEKRQVGRRR